MSLQVKKEKRSTPCIVLAGLDNSGKSTLLSTFNNAFHPLSSPPAPTSSPRVDRVRLGCAAARVVDLPGAAVMRPLWGKYAAGASVLVYVVDATDVERMSEAMRELHAMYKGEDGWGKVKEETPLVILCNKADGETAVGVEKVKKVMDLDALPVKSCVLVPCSATTGMNLKAIMACITQLLPVRI